MRDPATIVAAPGTQALIQLLPRLVPRSTVAIVGPTYAEHEALLARHGHAVTIVAGARRTPTSWSWSIRTIRPGGCSRPPSLAAVKGLLVVDEAFIDFLPRRESLAGDLPPRTVVLRSFGKTYGLAGVRLGFAIASPDYRRAAAGGAGALGGFGTGARDRPRAP